MTNLITLTLVHNKIITNEGISHLTNITNLDIGSNININDNSIYKLINLKN